MKTSRAGAGPGGPRRRWMTTAVAVVTGGTIGLVGAQPVVADTLPSSASPGTDPWVSTVDAYHRFTVPQADVEKIVGSRPSVLELEGTFGPHGTLSDLALDPSGSDYSALLGPLEPGLYQYRYVATMNDRSKVVFDAPTSAATTGGQPTWDTLFVPGSSVAWMSDVSQGGGSVRTLGYGSAQSGGERSALVWTPPGYDASRRAAYPVLYLLGDEDQGAAQWADLGRAPQILDNLAARGALSSMVVVMAGGTSGADEVLHDLVPATRAAYHVSSRPSEQALAGVGDGATEALRLLVDHAGTFGAVGSFSGSFSGAVSRTDAAAVDRGTDLLRLYVGNELDPSYNATYSLLRTLDRAGVRHEFDGVDPDNGATWTGWRQDLRDFAGRLFQHVRGHGMSSGHRALTFPYTPPPAGSITTPHVDRDRIVTFETGTQWADAKDVTVWGNWAPNGAWFRIPMTKVGDRWRLTLGPLDGFYYYRYVVDGVDQKDPADTTTPLVGVSPLYVRGTTDTYLGDVPSGKGGSISELSYQSTVAGEQRKALVWTPPGYNPHRAKPYPVLYLQHGAGQSYGDWVETGRAKQILDNEYLRHEIVPMVVVMGNGNVSDFQSELLDNIVPAAERSYHVSTDPAQRALAGLSMGGMNTLSTVLAHPGEFAYVGSFSGFLFGQPTGVDVGAVNAGTTMLRIYSGDVSDFVYPFTQSLLSMFDTLGIRYQFDGYTVGPHGFDTWSKNLVDFLPRLFHDGPGAVEGHGRQGR